MTIRLLSEYDDPLALSLVYEESWKHVYKDIIPQDYLDAIPRGHWSSAVKAEGRRSLVLTDDGRIVGTACCCRSRLHEMNDWGEIISIYLLPEYMGKGHGSGRSA